MMEEEPKTQHEVEETLCKPDNYLVWAILVTIFCCLPFGIPAIVYAAMVNSYWNAKQYDAAKHAAQMAKKWTLISAIVGAACILIYVICMMFMGMNFAFWNNCMM